MRQSLMRVEGTTKPQYYIIQLPTPGEYQHWEQFISIKHFILREHKFCFEITTHTNNEIIQGWIHEIGLDPSKIITCDGIYEFYKEIGYDKKKKRFIDGHPREPTNLTYNELSGIPAAQFTSTES